MIGFRVGRWRRGWAVALAAGVWLAGSAVGAWAADAAAGKARYATCAACHGENGVSTIEGTPSLAGQPDGFIQWQLVYFRGGRRKSPVMEPMATGLSDADVRNLGAYLSSLPAPKAPAGADPDAALTATGAKVAEKHHCSSCHKDDFSGTQATARLAGQREDYLIKALHDFKSGQRTGGGVAAMADATYSLTDDDMRALAHFLSRRP